MSQSPPRFFPGQFTRTGWLGLVVIIAALERLALWFSYSPVIFDDSNSYRRLAGQILGSAPFDGTRSPGYPIFLAWLGPDSTIYAVQLILGFATTLLFFYLGWLVAGSQKAGAAAALLHTLNFGQLLFDANILAETLTTFFAMLSICVGVYLLKQENFQRLTIKDISLALLVGISGGLATQVRPQFIFLPFLIAFAIALKSLTTKNTKEHQAKPSTFNLPTFNLQPSNVPTFQLLSAILIPAVFINALWVNYIHSQFGSWSMSSVDGYHIVQHTGKFFEYVPDEDAAIRDTFLKYRAIQIAKTGRASNTIWEAIPELKEVSGLGFYKLSNKIQDISRQLILKYPHLYLASVFESWFWFWSAPFYWRPGAFGPLGDWLTQAQRVLLWGANAIFVAGTFALIFRRVRELLAMPSALWLGLSIVWSNAILQAIVQASENPRYSISTQTLVVLVVAWWLWYLFQAWRQARKPIRSIDSI